MNDREQYIKILEQVSKKAEKMPDVPVFITPSFAEGLLAILKEQEEKTGHWIYESQFADCWSNTCSECGKRFTNAIDSFAHYCWNCGAKMESR